MGCRDRDRRRDLVWLISFSRSRFFRARSFFLLRSSLHFLSFLHRCLLVVTLRLSACTFSSFPRFFPFSRTQLPNSSSLLRVKPSEKPPVHLSSIHHVLPSHRSFAPLPPLLYALKLTLLLSEQITAGEPILRCQNTLGEGPLWDTEKGVVNWVDIEKVSSTSSRGRGRIPFLCELIGSLCWVCCDEGRNPYLQS